MPSQYGEHAFILEYFAGSSGRFLDIGSFDGVTFSNTRPLADAGWSGVCVEPSPPAFCQLMRNYEGNSKVELVCAAIVTEGSLRKFHCNTLDAVSADMLSTFEDSHRNKFHMHPFRDVWVPCLNWAQALAPFWAGSFRFVNIDVEGLNADVLAAMPLRPEMVCVELDPADGDRPEQTLASFGYRNRKLIGGNILAWR